MELRAMHSYSLSATQERKGISQEHRKSSSGKNQGFTTMIAHNPKSVLICGHASGAIYVWRRSKQLALNDGGNSLSEFITPLSHEKLKDPKIAHKGPVTCLRIQPSTGFLYSASVDRTVKLWDIFHSEHVASCVQTFAGHGGSVTSIDFGSIGPAPGLLFTGSTDRTVAIWKNAEGRDIMLYPFYVKMRVLELKAWPNCLIFCSQRLNQGDLFIGDGDAHLLRLHIDTERRGSKDAQPERWHAAAHGHQLGVTALAAEVHEGFLFTLSNDTAAKVWELGPSDGGGSGAGRRAKKSLRNDNRVKFNGMCVDAANQELLMVDDVGWLHVWSWVSERLVFSAPVSARTDPLLSVACNPDGTEIMVQRHDRVDSFYVIRGTMHVALKGHEGALVGVGFLGSGHDDLYAGGEVLFSCAVDNTLRSWDPLSMQCSEVLRDTAATERVRGTLPREMSAFALLKRHNAVLTGNDDGTVRMWGLDSGAHGVQKGHSNTVSAIAVAWTGRTESDPAGRDLVFTCGFDGEILTWEVQVSAKKAEGGEESRRLTPVGRTRAHRDEILCCAYFPPDMDPVRYPNGVLLTAGNDLHIKKWTVTDRQELELAGELECDEYDAAGVPAGKTRQCHRDAISGMAVDANFLFTASDDGAVRIWDVRHEFLVKELTNHGNGHADPVRKCLILPGSGFLVTLAADSCVKVWDYPAAAVLWETVHQHGEITCWCYDERKRGLVCGTEDWTIVSLDLPDLDALRARMSSAPRMPDPTASGPAQLHDEGADQLEAVDSELVGAGGSPEPAEGEVGSSAGT